MNQEEGIRMIAYHIWEEEGCGCHGNDVQHWLKAETIWQERNKPLKIEAEIIPSIRNQQINTAGNAKPAAVLSAQQNKKYQFSKRKA
jgi:hypothetical protein